MEITRRKLLTASLLGALGWMARPQTALGAISVEQSPDRATERHLLVTIFLRGGADGLSLVTPHGDDDYYRARPTIALPRPKQIGTYTPGQTIDLDGYFGLHPALGALYPLYASGQMAIVHACGSGDQTRSHFEAMATIERGLNRDSGPGSGWLARHLASAAWDNPSPLRAIALGAMLPESLRGAVSATALSSVDELRLAGASEHQSGLMEHALRDLYHNPNPNDVLAHAGQETLSVLKQLQTIAAKPYQSALGVHYPKDALGDGLRQVAYLAKCGIGLETASLDQGGYDTHIAQGTIAGQLSTQLASLANSIAAFAQDLGPTRWAQTTVVVLSEFGRRVSENSGAGTDHGRAGVMFVLGGTGIAGGKVHGRWPGLKPDQLEGPGDLSVTTDYRNVLSEILATRLGNSQIASVFPGLHYQPIGLTHG